MTVPIATNFIDLSIELSQATTLVLAPHMDDAVLGCGGTLAKLTTQSNIHVVYATDGSRSPVPHSLRAAQPSPELSTIRAQEAKTALQELGVPYENIHFLNFPDGALRRYRSDFRQSILQLLQRLKPSYVLMPFRYDCHTDHIAVNALTTDAISSLNSDIRIFEYFIYYRLQLLPNKDIRTYIRPEHLIRSDIHTQAAQKRRSLEAFKTQTTRFYTWQTRPLLSVDLLDEVCTKPEFFLQVSAKSQHSLFIRGDRLVPIISQLEPALKKIKSRGVLFIATLANSSRVLFKSFGQ